MDKLIQTIQEEINQLMQSKIAKKTDKQLWAHDVRRTSYELTVKMYEEYQNLFLSLKEIGKKNGLSVNGVQKAFNFYGFKTRTSQQGLLKNLDSKESDIKNGMSEKEFCSKYNSTRCTYYRYKRNLKKDLAD
jgi:hypothetical protein